MVDTIIQADSGESDIDIIRFGSSPQSTFVIASIENLCVDGTGCNDLVGINVGNNTKDYSPQPAYLENVRFKNFNQGASGAGNVSTSGTSTTVTFTEDADYNDVNVGTAIIAGNKLRIILSKDGGRNVTVNRAVDWSTPASVEYSDYRAGVVVASWFTELHNCEFQNCDIGIKLIFNSSSGMDVTNCTMILHCHLWDVYTGIYIDGNQNVIQGCNIGGIKDDGTGIEIHTRTANENKANYISGNYIEADAGNTQTIGVFIPTAGNTILGNYFDLPTSGNEIKISGSPSGNVILSNYNGKTATKVLNSSIDSNVGIGTTSPVRALCVKDSSNNQQAIFGYGRTSGQSEICVGETASSDKCVVLGYDHSGKYASLHIAGETYGYALVVANGGDIGIGDTTPSYKLDVNGDIRVQSGSDYYHGTSQGATGQFEDNNGNTITVSGGIITDLGV